MKKRLISMLMAVLMIASLLPASAVLADSNTCPADPAGKGKHEYTNVSIKKDTEKKTPGVDFKVCKNCGEIKTDSITVTRFKLITWGHTCSENATMVAKEATCRNQGLTISYCTECGKEFANKDFTGNKWYKIENALEHVYDEFHAVQEPTCNDDGWGYAVCKLCKDPAYVAGPDAAWNMVKFENFNNDIVAYSKAKDAAKAVFAAKNPGHTKTDLLVTVKSEIKNFVNDEDETVTLKPAEEREHYAYRISGVYDPTAEGTNKIVPLTEETVAVKYVSATKNGSGYVFTAEEAPANPGGLGRTADMYCPVCKKVIEGTPAYKTTLDKEHQMELVERGFAPYVDANGNAVNGKTDTWQCKTCTYSNGTPKQFGGKTLLYKDYFNPNAEKIKDGTEFTIPAVPAKCAKNGEGTKGMTAITLSYDAKTSAWVVKTPGREIEPKHTMVKQYGLAPTCEQPGYIYNNYSVCSVCGHEDGLKTDIENRAALGHKDVIDLAVYGATCQHKGFSVKYCTVCKEYIDVNGKAITKENPSTVDYKITNMVDKHVASDKLANVKEATCTEEGYTGDVVCKFCGEVMKPGEKTKMVDHTPVAVEAKAPTCTEPGISKGTVCKVCEKVLSGQETVPALGHDPKLVNAKDATCTEAGYSGDKVCTRCNVTLEKGKDIKALGHNFVKGVCSRCDAKQPGYNPFSDVKSTDRFYSDIMWAWENGIVEGDDTGMFRADGKLTRAQVVTMLWRMNDKPTAKNAATFTDLTQDWYKAAVAWAVEKGIVNGVGNNKFAPNETCTRAQIVTMLWRLDGEKKVTPTINFTDLTQNWYKDAVAWAANNGITKGDGVGHFYPANDCTRGEAVAFIHRTAMLGK